MATPGLGGSVRQSSIVRRKDLGHLGQSYRSELNVAVSQSLRPRRDTEAKMSGHRERKLGGS